MPARKRFRLSILNRIRNNFLAGVVVVAPVALTFWFIWSLVGWMDGWVLPFVPQIWQPEHLVNLWLGNVDAVGRVDASHEDYININIRGVGVVVFLIFTFVIGWLAKGYLGRSLLRFGEGMVGQMPVVRSIYNAVKQIAETVLSKSESSFEKACLVEYPRTGIWAIAFISTEAKGEIKSQVNVDDLIAVFLPTTPNPTSGFLLFVPRSQVKILDLSVEDAAKLVISAGLVYPNGDAPSSQNDDATPLPIREQA